MQKLKHLWESRHIPLERKLRIFNSCIKPIFISQSELWTLTACLENQINAFQRKLLRKLLNIKWPTKISNKELYTRLHQERKWSLIISEARLRWLGHALRLPETTPARRALIEAKRKMKKYRGGQKLTWLTIVKKQLISLGIDWGGVYAVAQKRGEWRNLIHRWRRHSAEISA